MAPLEEFHRDISARIKMERFHKYHDKESMKTAIMKQDAIFRQQVHELHSLYRVQKQLMTNLKNTEQNVEQRNVSNETGSCRSHYNNRDEIRPSRTFDLELPAEEYIRNGNRDMTRGLEQENDLELTLATGCRQKKRGNVSYASDSGITFSASSTDSADHGVGVPHLQYHISSEMKSSFDLEEQKPKKRFDPPWSLPCLSLKIG